MDRPRPPSNSADDATDEVWFEDVTFEVMVGYCRTPDRRMTADAVPGERLMRCFHCMKFCEDMPNHVAGPRMDASVVLLDVAGPSMDSSTALEASAEASVGVSPQDAGYFKNFKSTCRVLQGTSGLPGLHVGYFKNSDAMFECETCSSAFVEEFFCWRHVCSREECHQQPRTAEAVQAWSMISGRSKKK